MKLIPVLALLAIALCGCGEKSVVVSDTPPASSAPIAATTISTEKNVGDVEATVGVELALAQGAPPTVLAEELRNAQKKLNMLTVTVSPPKPDELWIAITLKPSEDFPDRPAALRGKVFREVTKDTKVEIATFQTVLDGHASPSSRRDPAGTYFPLEFRADAVKDLTELPPTMLIYAEVEAYMAPPETDPATIDPATYTTGPEDRGNLLSNPVRVNYSTTPLPVALGPVLDPTAVPAAPDASLVPPAVTEPAPAPAVETPPAAAPAAEAPAVPPVTEAPANTAPATQAVGAAQ